MEAIVLQKACIQCGLCAGLCAEVLRAEDIDFDAFKEATKDVAAEFIAKGDFTQEF